MLRTLGGLVGLRRAPLFLLAAAGLLVGCNDNSGDTTIINQGLDCGLIYNDLRGTWQVNLASGDRTLTNCGLQASNGTVVDASNGIVTYPDVTVVGAAESTSLAVIGDRTDAGDDPTQAFELMGSVEADSCLALFRVWDAGDAIYFSCFGTFDIPSQSIQASCDAAEFDEDRDGLGDYSCDLSNTIGASVNVF